MVHVNWLLGASPTITTEGNCKTPVCKSVSERKDQFRLFSNISEKYVQMFLVLQHMKPYVIW